MSFHVRRQRNFRFLPFAYFSNKLSYYFSCSSLNCCKPLNSTDQSNPFRLTKFHNLPFQFPLLILGSHTKYKAIIVVSPSCKFQLHALATSTADKIRYRRPGHSLQLMRSLTLTTLSTVTGILNPPATGKK